MIEPDMKYIVTVQSAVTTKSKEDTLGLHLVFGCSEGTIGHTIWITEKSKASAKKSILAMGVPEAALSTAAFWNNPYDALKNATAQIVTESDSYNNKTRTRVKWINAPHFAEAAPPEAAEALAGMFVANDDVPW